MRRSQKTEFRIQNNPTNEFGGFGKEAIAFLFLHG